MRPCVLVEEIDYVKFTPIAGGALKSADSAQSGGSAGNCNNGIVPRRGVPPGGALKARGLCREIVLRCQDGGVNDVLSKGSPGEFTSADDSVDLMTLGLVQVFNG